MARPMQYMSARGLKPLTYNVGVGFRVTGEAKNPGEPVRSGEGDKAAYGTAAEQEPLPEGWEPDQGGTDGNVDRLWRNTMRHAAVSTASGDGSTKEDQTVYDLNETSLHCLVFGAGPGGYGYIDGKASPATMRALSVPFYNQVFAQDDTRFTGEFLTPLANAVFGNKTDDPLLEWTAHCVDGSGRNVMSFTFGSRELLDALASRGEGIAQLAFGDEAMVSALNSGFGHDPQYSVAYVAFSSPGLASRIEDSGGMAKLLFGEDPANTHFYQHAANGKSVVERLDAIEARLDAIDSLLSDHASRLSSIEATLSSSGSTNSRLNRIEFDEYLIRKALDSLQTGVQNLGGVAPFQPAYYNPAYYPPGYP